jgi:hypothetical protein
MMSDEFSAAGEASSGNPASGADPKPPRRQATRGPRRDGRGKDRQRAEPVLGVRDKQLSNPHVMTDEPDASSTDLGVPADRPERPERPERQAPVGNVRDARSRAARDQADAAPREENEETLHERDDQFPPRDPVSGESSGGEDDGGEDDRAAHRNGRNKRRRRGRGEDSEGSSLGSAPERVALDPEEVSRRAWKIYLGEVSEEGLALINDNTARDMAKRSFRLAEIFIEEQSRRG